MRAVQPETEAGAPKVGDSPEPSVGAGEVRVRVVGAGLNRADLLQLRGQYPPPPGESALPGLELSGVIDQLGEGVVGWTLGQPVMALTAGGAQAELASVPVGQLLRPPFRLSLLEAAALPEVALTAWTNLVAEGGLVAGETVLITGAASGVGSFAVQLARELGARVLVAGRSRERLERLVPWGASACFELSEGLANEVRAATDGKGADLVLDLVGGEWLPRALASLAPRGRLVLVGLMAGREAKLDLGLVLSRRLRVIGSVLRSRSRAEKAELVAAFQAFAGERLEDGRLQPVIERIFPLEQAADAYAHLESGAGLGKVLLEVEASFGSVGP
jgi:putative PIG3 family NAD(P)H quinone oxidoreductase